MPARLLHLAMFLLVLIPGAHSHSKGVRRSKPSPPLWVNMSQVEYSEQQFMKWVKFVGSLKHSVFKTAKNKVFPSYILTVDKNPALGDFTTIQDAIDSLPAVNLIRVLINVHAGVYSEKVTIGQMKSFITIEGAGADKTIVEWGDTAQTAGPNGRPLGTYGSATFAVNSGPFLIKNGPRAKR